MKKAAGGDESRPTKKANVDKDSSKKEKKGSEVKKGGSKAKKEGSKKTPKMKKEYIEVARKMIKKSMPKLPKDGSNPPAVHYNNGVIYTSRNQRKFRALTTRGDAYSEKGALWGGDKPTTAAWLKAIKAVDDANNK